MGYVLQGRIELVTQVAAMAAAAVNLAHERISLLCVDKRVAIK
ncbi:hypothetical protein V2J76_19295 [Pseudomonas alliivorans]|nr:hypothetical protein [Pseudomonas alliivorans]